MDVEGDPDWPAAEAEERADDTRHYPRDDAHNLPLPLVLVGHCWYTRPAAKKFIRAAYMDGCERGRALSRE